MSSFRIEPGGRVTATQITLRELVWRAYGESTEMPVYVLVLARRDGKLGDELRPSRIDCAEVRARRSRGHQPPADTGPDCNLSMTFSGATMTARFAGENADGIARLLTAPDTQRVVINRTGLAGTYDGTLALTPAPLPCFPPLPGSENGTAIFTAVQEQLGLRLQSDRAPVTVLTIVSAQKPVE
jgi:uncharacterized protein (TIGR03435 family)